MTLHIALDEISGLGKSTQAQKLQRFLMQKSYRVKAITPLQNEITTYYIATDKNLLIPSKKYAKTPDYFYK